MTTGTPQPADRNEQEEASGSIQSWGNRNLGEPCDAVPFHWKRFHLEEFSGRQEVGTYPIWLKITWGLFLPVLVLYGIIRYKVREGLEDLPGRNRKPGTIRVSGPAGNSSPTSLIDQVKRAPRPLWLVFTTTRLAIVQPSKSGGSPTVVWQTDDAAQLRFNHDDLNSINIVWPDQCHASFFPAPEQRAKLTRSLVARQPNPQNSDQ